MIRAIVAVDKKWGIGKKNDLLFNIPLDMKFFREKTAGTTVCMGYNTLLSFPNSKPLPKRKNIVLCADCIERDDVVMVHSLEDMLSAIKNVDFDGDAADTIGAFLAIVMMPLTYSIANGIMFAILGWVILKLAIGKIKDISAVMWISVALFVLYIVLKVLGLA